MPLAERLRRLLPGLWAGGLLAVALLATPAVFAQLSGPQAGRLVGQMLAQEAHASLAIAFALLLLERRAAGAAAGGRSLTGMGLALAALGLTLAGYFAVQPLMPAARAGQGGLSFGQLHAISAACYAAKLLAVLALAWRAAGGPKGRA